MLAEHSGLVYHLTRNSRRVYSSSFLSTWWLLSEYINLNNPDEQCKYSHSGLLCGKCKESLSLVLGSSQCKKCSNSYLALLIPFALAGVLLVMLLFLLDLTVKAGTLHGLIFYSNVVAANHHIFIPQSANNPASIFIAWLNLDLTF